MKLYDEHSKVDFVNEPMFFGSGRNLQRYDKNKYVWYFDQGEKMDAVTWKPNEISLTKDAMDFKVLEPHEERIFTLNIKRQEILDSLQGRAPMLTFGRITTLPELEYAIIRWTFQESNHSNTYAHILRNIYPNPSKVFDEILDDAMITKHTTFIAQHYEDLYAKINAWEYLPEGHPDRPTLKEMKRATYLALVSVNILEGVRFYVSFACTFAFAENKKMVGNAGELKLIARDENLHLALTQKMINHLTKNADEGFQEVIAECENEVREMYRHAAEDEIEWAQYLFEDGSILGLNANILEQYMKFMTNTRMRGIGLSKLYPEVTTTPLPWMGSWLGTEKTEVLPQEEEITSYIIGAVSDDMEESDWA